jgi:hypothetical protein
MMAAIVPEARLADSMPPVRDEVSKTLRELEAIETLR